MDNFMKYYTNTDTATNETVTYKRYLSDAFTRYERSLEGVRLVIPNPIIPSPAKIRIVIKHNPFIILPPLSFLKKRYILHYGLLKNNDFLL